MANNLLEQAEKLKVAIERAKKSSLNQRTVLLQKLSAGPQKQQVGKIFSLSFQFENFSMLKQIPEVVNVSQLKVEPTLVVFLSDVINLAEDSA